MPSFGRYEQAAELVRRLRVRQPARRDGVTHVRRGTRPRRGLARSPGRPRDGSVLGAASPVDAAARAAVPGARRRPGGLRLRRVLAGDHRQAEQIIDAIEAQTGVEVVVYTQAMGRDRRRGGAVAVGAAATAARVARAAVPGPRRGPARLRLRRRSSARTRSPRPRRPSTRSRRGPAPRSSSTRSRPATSTSTTDETRVAGAGPHRPVGHRARGLRRRAGDLLRPRPEPPSTARSSCTPARASRRRTSRTSERQAHLRQRHAAVPARRPTSTARSRSPCRRSTRRPRRSTPPRSSAARQINAVVGLDRRADRRSSGCRAGRSSTGAASARTRSTSTTRRS